MGSLKKMAYYKFVDEYQAFEFEGILLDQTSTTMFYIDSIGSPKVDELDARTSHCYYVMNCIMTKGNKNHLDEEEYKYLNRKEVTFTSERYTPVFLRELNEAETILYGKA